MPKTRILRGFLSAALAGLLAMAGVAAIGPAALRAEDEAAAPAAEAIRCEFPVLLVDSGQGNNARLLQALMRRARVDPDKFELNEMATADDLDGFNTLIIGVGASSKGLGAAGINTAQEVERTESIIAAAKERGMKVVGVHMGGDARRGELSDRFNALVYRHSDVFILWDGGNEDGFFTRLAAQHGEVVLRIVEQKTAVGDEMMKLFAAEG